MSKVIAKRARWNDSPYLARMVFSEMVRGQLDSDTGYGITPWPEVCDNEHELVILDTGSGRVNEVSPDLAVPGAPAPMVGDAEGASFEDIADAWEKANE